MVSKDVVLVAERIDQYASTWQQPVEIVPWEKLGDRADSDTPQQGVLVELDLDDYIKEIKSIVNITTAIVKTTQKNLSD